MYVKNLFCAACLILLPQLSFSETTFKEFPLEIAYEDDFPPYSFKKGTEVVGISADLIKMVVADPRIKALTGNQTSVPKKYPWDRIYKMLTERPNVISLAIARAPKREKLFHWIFDAGSGEENRIYAWKERDDIKKCSKFQALYTYTSRGMMVITDNLR